MSYATVVSHVENARSSTVCPPHLVRLRRLGVPRELAATLAAERAFSVHDLERLLAAGCPLGTALRIPPRLTARPAALGVAAEGEILEGSPSERISELARDRAARLVVVGSRRRRLTRSVSAGVMRTAGRPMIVAG